MKREPGTRVGAILGANAGKVEFLGYGVYQGDHIPEDENVQIFGVSLKREGHANPKILLDSGDVVWGCECWWGSEDQVRKMLAGRVVEIVNMRDYRLPFPTPEPQQPEREGGAR